MKAQVYGRENCPYCVKAKDLLEQKEIDKNELVAELEKMRNYLMKIKSENNELHIETFDIIEIAMDKKIKKKEK